MDTNSKNKEKSSIKLANFLHQNKIHKKDFAQMIGVTLSYIYNLIDDTIPFSGRSTTLERIATVMDIEPEEFEEYLIEAEPKPYNKNLDFLKHQIKAKGLTTAQYLKLFEKKKRKDVVDILRGAKSLPINYLELEKMYAPVDTDKADIFNIWIEVMVEYLNSGGFNTKLNEELANTMFDCARKYIFKK
jgi:transcriptional regulator with XRE-family HTH domain